MRLLIIVASGNGVIDERPFNGIKKLMLEFGLDKTVNLQQLKDTIRQQSYLVRKDEQRALNGLTALLPTKASRQRAMHLARELLSLSGPISDEKEDRLLRVAQVLKLHEKMPALHVSATRNKKIVAIKTKTAKAIPSTTRKPKARQS